jgi:ABC-2 type transport system ATP-binding protein
MNKLEVRNISKNIKGQNILSNINLDLEEGNIYGFIGRNGSGKTMLFRALAGFINTDEGEISYNGQILHKDMDMLPSLGIVLGDVGMYSDFTGYKNLYFLSQFNKKIGKNEIEDAIKRVGLNPADKRTLKKYSLGMKQRILIAQAIMERPEIIMLDEPTNALDEQGVEEIRKVIMQEKERGAIVLLASHNKEDIELLADNVFRIDNGKLIDKVGTDT